MVLRKLKVAIIETDDMRLSIDDQGHTILSGVEGNFLQLLMNTMEIPYKLVIASDGEWGRELDNGTWTGMIGVIQRGEADIAINKLSITEDRMKVVDFSIPYCDEVVTFGAAAPRRIFPPFLFLDAFDSVVWILCAVVLAILPLVYTILSRDFTTYGTTLFKIFGCLMNQPVINKNNSTMYRFFVTLCLVFSVVISSSYCAVIFCFLTIPFHEPKLRNFHDLSKAVLGGEYKCQTVLGSYIMSLLLTSVDKNLQMIGEMILQNSWTYRMNIHEDRDLNHNVATISTMADLKKINLFQTELAFSEEILLTTYIGIALKKKFNYKSEINRAINKIVNGGMYAKLEAGELLALAIHKSRVSTENHREKPLVFENVYGVFIALVFGYLLSFSTLVGEILFYYIPLRFGKKQP